MRGITSRNLVLGAIALFSATLSASPIAGTFDIGGTVTVSATTIKWVSLNAPFPADITTIGSFPTGAFSALGGASAVIKDLDSAVEPVGVPFPDQLFMSFPSAPSLPALNINFIFPGFEGNPTCGPPVAAVSQACTPGPPIFAGTSPFNFVNNPGGVAGSEATASFVFRGDTSDHLSTWFGNFTSQFNVPYQNVLAAFGPNGTGSVTNTYSATITVIPNVPEPSPMILMGSGLGLLLFSMALRRRFSRQLN